VKAIEAAAKATGTPVSTMRALAQHLRQRHAEAGKKPVTASRSTTVPAGTVALRERKTPKLEDGFKRLGLPTEAARAAARGRGGVRQSGSLVEGFRRRGLSERAARVAAAGRHGVLEAVKNIAGLPASCFAWIPDSEDASTWQLQISRSGDIGSGWAPDEDLVRAAVAKLPGVAAYDQALDIPAADLPGVKSILRSAWIACGADLDEMPYELNQEALRQAFLGLGLSEKAAAIAARGRQGRS
jgi:hypothetical protein